MDEILSVLYGIVAYQLDVDRDKLNENSRFDELHADDIDVIEIILAAEDEFDVEVPDELMMSFDTIGSLAAYLSKIID